jgi:hypothetical protein
MVDEKGMRSAFAEINSELSTGGDFFSLAGGLERQRPRTRTRSRPPKSRGWHGDDNAHGDGPVGDAVALTQMSNVLGDAAGVVDE